MLVSLRVSYETKSLFLFHRLVSTFILAVRVIISQTNAGMERC